MANDKLITVDVLGEYGQKIKNYVDVVTGVNNAITGVVENVATTSWTNTNSGEYPWRYTISNANITSTHTPSVTFDLDAAISGNFSPTCESIDGGIYVYAKAQPTSTVHITYSALKIGSTNVKGGGFNLPIRNTGADYATVSLENFTGGSVIQNSIFMQYFGDNNEYVSIWGRAIFSGTARVGWTPTLKLTFPGKTHVYSGTALGIAMFIRRDSSAENSTVRAIRPAYINMHADCLRIVSYESYDNMVPGTYECIVPQTILRIK